MPITNKAVLTSNISKSGQKIPTTTESNVHVANELNTDITITKSTERLWTIANDTFVVTTKIANNTNFDIEDIYMKDTLTEGASLKPGSVKIGQTEYPDADPIAGYTFPVTLGSEIDIDITYEVVIDERPTVTSIKNSGQVKVTVDTTPYTIDSNELEIPVENNELYVLKEASTNVVKIGDQITYTITISNQGTIANTDLVLNDQLSDSVIFVAGSIKIDDVAKPDLDISDGIQLADLDTNQQTKVEFTVDIIK